MSRAMTMSSSEGASVTVEAARRVLSIGVGGLGSPVLLILARSVDVHVTLVDDDRVQASNLHRQLLYRDDDVGRSKLDAARERLTREAASHGRHVSIDTIEGRFVPENAVELARGHDVIVEGADNFATKFLAADAAQLAGTAIVHAGVVRWAGYALGVLPGRSACLRCLFEDLPRGEPETCATAGVVGPVVGTIGALQAALVIRLLLGDAAAGGTLFHHDARRSTLRRTRLAQRADCPLCGARASIDTIEASRYGAENEHDASCAS
jgi:molybdopterin/thiamine biosynthesis adenylyltransferase